MQKNIFGLLLLSFLLSISVTAQDYNDQLRYRKWRITLFPPISTNGANTTDFSAKYSLNLIAGYHGALDGYEVGALFNYNKFYSYGFQLAGLVNATGGDMAGLNIAGVSNYTNDDMTGVQFAGGANISNEGMSGIQLSGLINYSKEMLEGIQVTMGLNYSGRGSSGLQFAGVANVSNRDIEGLQFGGLFNYTKYDISGLQAAGFFNYAGDNVEGLQATLGFNYAEDGISGLQAAGVANISDGTIEGLLASGLLNYSRDGASGLIASLGFNISKEIEGLSAAGIGNFAKSMQGLQFAAINVAEDATGLQFGILNIAKEFNGAPVGLLSIYGNGRKNLDVRFSDAGFTEIGITTGTYRVYNSFLFGYNTLLDREVYRLGLAIGLEKNIQDSFENIESTTLFVNQEFSIHQHFEGEWSKTKNRIYSYKYLVGNRFVNGLSVYGGPSLNMQVTRVNEANDYTWYSFWSPTRKGRQYRFWVGLTIGVRLFHQKNLPLIDDDFKDDWGWGRDW